MKEREWKRQRKNNESHTKPYFANEKKRRKKQQHVVHIFATSVSEEKNGIIKKLNLTTTNTTTMITTKSKKERDEEKSQQKKPATHYTFRLNHFMYNRSRTHFFNTQSWLQSVNEWELNVACSFHFSSSAPRANTQTLPHTHLTTKANAILTRPLVVVLLPSSIYSLLVFHTHEYTQEFLPARFGRRHCCTRLSICFFHSKRFEN